MGTSKDSSGIFNAENGRRLEKSMGSGFGSGSIAGDGLKEISKD
jgi:hypothetical protein